jgi:hypothetical protein
MENIMPHFAACKTEQNQVSNEFEVVRCAPIMPFGRHCRRKQVYGRRFEGLPLLPGFSILHNDLA